MLSQSGSQSFTGCPSPIRLSHHQRNNLREPPSLSTDPPTPKLLYNRRQAHVPVANYRFLATSPTSSNQGEHTLLPSRHQNNGALLGSSQQRPSDSLREREEVPPIRMAGAILSCAIRKGGARSGSGRGAVHRNVSKP